MRKMKTGKGFFWCSLVCMGITLFLVAPAMADWETDALNSMLILNTEVSVLGPSSDPNFPGYVETPVFDGGIQQAEVNVNDIIKIEATLEIKPEMSLPMQIRVIFGGAGYLSAPRDWTLRSPGIYSNRSYFMVTSEGTKTIGLKAWVKWLPEGELPSATDSTTILDQVVVGP